ncbi:MAG: hypothetical protein CVV44_06010 [Spirochaetae bacterium HGW-Spirochaetae-1]|jgi:hypothetical protein|nr:MAG: hypothetical protein CVV44_06010 [Spirochaetae bacterium HGW-Spirochaetae-1]
MEVNTAYTNTYSGNYQAVMNLPAEETANALPAMKTPQEVKQAEIQEKVMMDLQDVQNFLYTLIGSKLRVHEGKSIPGASLNVSA